MRISALTLLIEDELAFLGACRAKDNKPVYLLCGRAYFANKFGYSIRQVSRAFQQLALRGWQIRQRRTDHDGNFRTNVFIPKGYGRPWRLIREKLARLTGWRTKQTRLTAKIKPHRGPQKSAISSPECEITSSSEAMQRFFPKKMPA